MGSGVLKKTGSFIGTGAAKVISLDFTPRYVLCINVTDLEKAELSDDFGVDATKAGGISTDVAGAITALAAGAGIILGDRQFTVGTDNSCNGAADTIAYLAFE